MFLVHTHQLRRVIHVHEAPLISQSARLRKLTLLLQATSDADGIQLPCRTGVSDCASRQCPSYWRGSCQNREEGPHGYFNFRVKCMIRR